MDEMTDDQRVREIRERLNTATPGPWSADQISMPQSWDYWEINAPNVPSAPGSSRTSRRTDLQIAEIDNTSGLNEKANAEFIGHAPDDVAFLLSQIDALKSDVARLLKVLQALRQVTRVDSLTFEAMKQVDDAIRDAEDPTNDLPA